MTGAVELRRLFHESLHGDWKTDTQEFQIKVKTYLFHIKTNPKTEKLYASCLHYIDEFKNQKQPTGMTYADWERTRISPNDVIKFLKKALCSQNAPVERDVIDLVKSGNSVHLKVRSEKNKSVSGKVIAD